MRFEVEQASRGLSAIAQLLAILTIVLFLLPYTHKALLAEMCRIRDFKGWVTFRLYFRLKGYVSR